VTMDNPEIEKNYMFVRRIDGHIEHAEFPAAQMAALAFSPARCITCMKTIRILGKMPSRIRSGSDSLKHVRPKLEALSRKRGRRLRRALRSWRAEAQLMYLKVRRSFSGRRGKAARDPFWVRAPRHATQQRLSSDRRMEKLNGDKIE